MATNVPAKVKTPELSRFIVRAAQLETAKPVIAYWCEYWIVNQILAKGLHNGDPETLEYTTTLMDKLEQVGASSIISPLNLTKSNTDGMSLLNRSSLRTLPMMRS